MTQGFANSQYNVNAPTISSGSGAPSSTPSKVGDVYLDTTAKREYRAYGISSSSDWKKINGAEYIEVIGTVSGAWETKTISSPTTVTTSSDITFTASDSGYSTFTLTKGKIYSLTADISVADWGATIIDIKWNTNDSGSWSAIPGGAPRKEQSSAGQGCSTTNNVLCYVSGTGTYKVSISTGVNVSCNVTIIIKEIL